MVDGRFCFEGGSQCGKGEGLHVLLTDRAEAVARAFQSAALNPAPALTWRAPQRPSHGEFRVVLDYYRVSEEPIMHSISSGGWVVNDFIASLSCKVLQAGVPQCFILSPLLPLTYVSNPFTSKLIL